MNKNSIHQSTWVTPRVYWWNSYCSIFSVCVQCLVDHCLSFHPYLFGYCNACPCSIYGFWLHLCYLQILVSIRVQPRLFGGVLVAHHFGFLCCIFCFVSLCLVSCVQCCSALEFTPDFIKWGSCCSCFPIMYLGVLSSLLWYPLRFPLKTMFDVSLPSWL